MERQVNAFTDHAAFFTFIKGFDTAKTSGWSMHEWKGEWLNFNKVKI
jgi:hypothetical protein